MTWLVGTQLLVQDNALPNARATVPAPVTGTGAAAVITAPAAAPQRPAVITAPAGKARAAGSFGTSNHHQLGTRHAA